MTEQPRWAVQFYKDAQGNIPAWEYVQSLPSSEQAAMLRILDMLRDFGVMLKRPYAAQIEGNLWELRAGAGRLFYCAYSGRRFIILHGFRKKSQKAPRKEIEAALRRWADFLERGEK